MGIIAGKQHLGVGLLRNLTLPRVAASISVCSLLVSTSGVVVGMRQRECGPSKEIPWSLDLSFAGGDDLGTGSSDGIQIGGTMVQTFNQPRVMASSSSSESTLRFFEWGEGGTG